MALDGLYGLTDLNMEFVRDPSCWLEAEKLEAFLCKLDQTYGLQFSESLVTKVGHDCNRLRSWGVLDSVLRMMQKPQDIFCQPERFMSYFISPEPPIGNLKVTSVSVTFDFPISSFEFPYVTEYIKAAIEGLPQYLGKQNALVEWDDCRIHISWSAAQVNLLDDEILGKTLKPELLQSMVASLEDLQHQIERKNEELKYRDQEINRLKADIKNLLSTPITRRFRLPQQVGQNLPEEVEKIASEVKNEIFKLSDYIARAEQLVTLLTGKTRLNNQIKTAMRRVGWDQVLQGKTHATRRSVDLLEELKSTLAESTQPVTGAPVTGLEDSVRHIES